MNLRYRVLWFENEPDFVTEITPGITSYLLEDLGLDLEIDTRPSGADVDTLVMSGDYDLIVTDLNLDDGDTGKNLIDRIRADEVLTEVLLYSGNGQEIQEIIDKTPGLQRVSYAVGRPALPDRLKKIIAVTVKKVQDVHNMRGLVITEAIDLEGKMLDIITAHFTTSGDDAEKTAFIKYHYDKKDGHFKSQLGKINAHTPDTILGFIEEACGDMYPKYIALNKLLDDAKGKLDSSKPDDKAKLAILEQLEAELENMKDQVIDLRNDLAHVREEKDTQGRWILKNKKGTRQTVFDDNKYADIRRNLRKHAKNLIEIAKHLP